MDFSNNGRSQKKYLNDIIVFRMLYLDYFFLFMGQNALTDSSGNLMDSNLYLFLMKEM